MGHHGGFDFGRIDVGAAAQDHVGEPVAEIEVAVGVEPADIAERSQPSERRFGSPEIVIGGAGAVIGQEKDLAGLAGRDIVAVLADDPQA